MEIRRGTPARDAVERAGGAVRALAATGDPLRDVEVKIGENGEGLVRSAAMLKEYHRRPDATAESIDAGEAHRYGIFHEIVPVSPWRWIFTKQLFIFPRMVHRIPELRRFFYWRYFYDEPQAALVIAIAVTSMSTVAMAMA